MKLTTWGALALALGFAAPADLRAQSRSQVEQTADVHDVGEADASVADELQDTELAQYTVASAGGRGGAGSSAMSAALLDRPIVLVAGAEYIYARPNFSEALAYVEQDIVNGRENWVQYDFGYDSTYSFYGGVYLADCGGAVIFDWTRLTGDASFAAASVPGQTAIFGPYEVDGNVEGFANVELNSYDLSFAKTIPLGCATGGCGAACGTSCDDACSGDGCSGDGCSGGCAAACCPPWDITWSGGLRWADVNWARGLTAFDVQNNNAVINSATTTMDFQGFGGRIGLAGRRYLGPQGRLSLYAKGDLSVLLGDIDVNTVVFDASSSSTGSFGTRCTHIVPVTEIELGGTLHLGAHAHLTAGYFFSAWHDLGFRDQYNFNQFQLSHYDDANILGWDGLFGRVEINF